jgi:hypothetical protein
MHEYITHTEVCFHVCVHAHMHDLAAMAHVRTTAVLEDAWWPSVQTCPSTHAKAEHTLAFSYA